MLVQRSSYNFYMKYKNAIKDTTLSIYVFCTAGVFTLCFATPGQPGGPSHFSQARSQNCEKQLLASSCLSVRPSFCASAWKNAAPTEGIFMKFYMSIFWKSVKKIQVSLKSDKNNGYFTWRAVYIYDISLNSSQNEKCFRQSCRESQNTHFMFSNIFPKIVPFMR
jgi:hypothetical protein